MQVFFFRTLSAIFILVAESAFIPILFPADSCVSLIFVAVILWTLLLGFRSSLWVTLPMLLVAETVFYSRVGPLLAFGLGLSALTAYLSFWVHYEQKGLTWIWYALIAASGTLLWHVLMNGWTGGWSKAWIESVISVYVTALIIFPLFSAMLSRSERFLTFHKREAFQKIRTS